MIMKTDMLPILIESCSSFLPIWQAMEAERGQDEPLIYSQLGRVAQHLVELQLRGQTAEFADVFEVIERLYVEGDDYVQNASTVGLLEGIQNIAGNRNMDREVFLAYLKPVSAARWQSLNRFWSGENAQGGASGVRRQQT